MKSRMVFELAADEAQMQCLRDMQCLFARACNALAPVVQAQRLWHRVALHHAQYHALRAQFPELGSQLVCNVIYAVSKSARVLFQSPQSPFYLARLGDKPLPLMRFSDDSPVYFDRHTLSLKAGRLSMFTLDGRMKFDLPISAKQEAYLQQVKLSEVLLSGTPQQGYRLTFVCVPQGAPSVRLASRTANAESVPEHVALEDVK